MRKTSVRDLHINTSELVREAEAGGVIVIERRGEPVAELRPVSAVSRLTAVEKERIIQRAERFAARLPLTDSTPGIEEDRDR
ncbi:MAG TPA: type II toxin-antitoxin system prevent-host-death family antitoxin [Bryobacteraceae bacterium]|nr:type II toxin-antitoxin system prevent-host-death family antitoxin [Bryobacteraceae bacterium]